MRPPGLLRHGKAKQRGAVLMIMIAILVVGFAAVLLGALSLSALNSARQDRTSAALAQAEQALLGRAVSDDNIPGSLPCPDTDDDGSSELLSGNDCPSYIGRLPWRTLNLPELRDGSGERLWYALSPAFRDDNSAQPLNSNTKGTLLVYGTDGITLRTQPGYSAVAVIFSPGSAVGAQTRNTVAQKNSAANYLDTVVFPGPITRNNATVGGPFIAGTKSDTFNDQLLFITTKNLMPLVEQRVAGVVKKALTDYYSASSGTPSNRYYPWADNLAAGDYDANDGALRGWLPYNAGTTNWPTTPDWVAGPPPSPPTWFFDNQWYTLIYYSLANNYSRDHNSGTLTVDSNSGVQVLFFMPGTYSGTRVIDELSHYLEDSENNEDGSPTTPDDTYVTPTSKDIDRDRIYWLSSTSNWNQ